MSTEDQKPRPKTLSRGRIGGIMIATGLVVGSVFAVQAVADNKTMQHFTAEAGYHMSFHRGAGKSFSELTDAELEKRINRVVRHVSIEIDATDDQEKKITALVTAVAKDARPLRKSFMDDREAMQDILLADQIDRAAMEKMRAARIAEVDEFSKNMMKAVADVAEVLTPEQRRTLQARIAEFRTMFGRGRGGRWRR